MQSAHCYNLGRDPKFHDPDEPLSSFILWVLAPCASFSGRRSSVGFTHVRLLSFDLSNGSSSVLSNSHFLLAIPISWIMLGNEPAQHIGQREDVR